MTSHDAPGIAIDVSRCNVAICAMTVVTRFAPSPTGELHLGHAYSARIAWQRAREAGGRFLLRIEDIDIRRSRREFEAAILDDLRWLGLDWDGDGAPPVRAFRRLRPGARRARRARPDLSLLLHPRRHRRRRPTRRTARMDRSIPAPAGICRARSGATRLAAGEEHCLRLDAARGRAPRPGPTPSSTRRAAGSTGQPLLFGDVVLARKDTPTSYHLAVTVDDHLQGVTLVTRGEDLLPSTHVHGLLQTPAGLRDAALRPSPAADRPAGRRFAKRDKSLTLRSLRESGNTPDDVFG